MIYGEINLEWFIGLIIWLGDYIHIYGTIFYDTLEGKTAWELGRLVCILVAFLFVFAVIHGVLKFIIFYLPIFVKWDRLKNEIINMTKKIVIWILGITKISFAALIMLTVVTWVGGIYFKDLGVPKKQEFEHSQKTVATEYSQQSMASTISADQCPAADLPTPESQTREALGQMGDFFGGMLNPILAFASFIALLYTIRLQSSSQSDLASNYKQDRAMALLVPEFHRYADSIMLLLAKAEDLAKLDIGSTPQGNNLEGIIKNAIDEASNRSSRPQLSQIANEINSQYSDNSDFNKNARNFLLCMNDACVLTKKFEFYRVEMLELVDSEKYPLFEDGASRMAKLLLLSEILCNVTFLSSFGIKSLVSSTPSFVSDEFKRYVNSAHSIDFS